MAENKSKKGTSLRVATTAKAGRRKVYTTGRRKTKDFHPSKGYMIPDRTKGFWNEHDATLMMNKLKVKSALSLVRDLERKIGVNNSDPFFFKRLRSQVRRGIIGAAELLPAFNKVRDQELKHIPLSI